MPILLLVIIIVIVLLFVLIPVPGDFRGDAGGAVLVLFLVIYYLV